MTDDIVKRLRTAQLYTTRDGEAADEIERLRAENEIHLKAVDDLNGIILRMQAANSELRATLVELVAYMEFSEQREKILRRARAVYEKIKGGTNDAG